jgi:hypothetical protein
MVFSWYPDGIWPQMRDTLRVRDGLSTAAQFIRNVTLLTLGETEPTRPRPMKSVKIREKAFLNR